MYSRLFLMSVLTYYVAIFNTNFVVAGLAMILMLLFTTEALLSIDRQSKLLTQFIDEEFCFKYGDHGKSLANYLNRLRLKINLFIDQGSKLAQQSYEDKAEQQLVLNNLGLCGVFVAEYSENEKKLIKSCYLNKEVLRVFQTQFNYISQIRSDLLNNPASLNSSLFNQRGKSRYIIQCQKKIALNNKEYAIFILAIKRFNHSLEQLLQLKEYEKYLIRSVKSYKRINSLQKKYIRSHKEKLNKNILLDSVAHDLRNPLNNLRGLLFYINNSIELDKQQQEIVGSGDVSISDIEILINNFLSISSYRAKQIELNLCPVDLAELVKESCQSCELTARSRQIKLAQRVSVKGCRVSVDVFALKRVLINLISNAIKYSSEGQEVIVVLAMQDSVPYIEVTDQGLGMSAEQIKIAGKPFHRFSDLDIEGVGLGLSVCKLYLELHKFEFTISSKPGAGSSFRIVCTKRDS